MLTKVTNLVSIGIITLLPLSCKNSITDSQDKPVQIAAVTFDDNSELTNWNLGSYSGHTELDSTIKFEGTRSIHFSPDSGCYVVDRKTGIEVQSGKRYSISFYAIVTQTKVGERSYCAGEFTLTIKQGNEEILYAPVFDAPVWEKKTFYFLAKNNLPVNLNLIVGNDVWLDNMVFVRELD